MQRDRQGGVALGVGAALVVVASLSWLSPGTSAHVIPRPQSAEQALTATSHPALDGNRASPSAPTPRPSLTRDRRSGVPTALPTRLRIPALGISAAIGRIQSGGSRILIPPDDYTTVGWWSGGVRPGARHGTAILVGHTVHTGGGALDDLGQIRVGGRAVIEGLTADLPYVVSSVTVYRKGILAQKAAAIFSQRGPGRVAVVTCDDWNGTTYLSNVVVILKPLGR